MFPYLEGTMDVCPDPETLAAYQEGRLPDGEARAFERHAAGCPDCRQTLRLMAEAKPVPLFFRPRVRSLTWAAAALLLLAGAWGFRPGPQPSRPGRSPRSVPPAAPGAFPSGILGTSSPVAYPVPGAELVLGAGARLEVREEEGAGLSLLPRGGKSWLRVWGETPLRLEVPGGRFILREGFVQVSLPSPPPAWSGLLRSAQAASQDPVEMVVLEGTLEGEDSGRFGRGTRLRLEQGGWRAGHLPAAAVNGLLREFAGTLAELPGREVFPEGLRVPGGGVRSQVVLPASPAYRWVTVLASRSAATELGLTVALPDSSGRVTWHEWVVGLAASGTGPSQVIPRVIEVSWDGGRLSGRVDGVLRFSAPSESARLLRPVAAGEGWGLTVWGGEVVLGRSVLQEVQP